MKIETFTIKGRKPFKVMRMSGGFSYKPSFLIIADQKIKSITGTMANVTKKPTSYQRKKIYKYLKVKNNFSDLNCNHACLSHDMQWDWVSNLNIPA